MTHAEDDHVSAVIHGAQLKRASAREPLVTMAPARVSCGRWCQRRPRIYQCPWQPRCTNHLFCSPR